MAAERIISPGNSRTVTTLQNTLNTLLKAEHYSCLQLKLPEYLALSANQTLPALLAALTKYIGVAVYYSADEASV